MARGIGAYAAVFEWSSAVVYKGGIDCETSISRCGRVYDHGTYERNVVKCRARRTLYIVGQILDTEATDSDGEIHCVCTGCWRV